MRTQGSPQFLLYSRILEGVAHDRKNSESADLPLAQDALLHELLKHLLTGPLFEDSSYPTPNPGLPVRLHASKDILHNLVQGRTAQGIAGNKGESIPGNLNTTAQVQLDKD